MTWILLVAVAFAFSLGWWVGIFLVTYGLRRDLARLQEERRELDRERQELRRARLEHSSNVLAFEAERERQRGFSVNSIWHPTVVRS